jgi:hypothetical protein
MDPMYYNNLYGRTDYTMYIIICLLIILTLSLSYFISISITKQPEQPGYHPQQCFVDQLKLHKVDDICDVNIIEKPIKGSNISVNFKSNKNEDDHVYEKCIMNQVKSKQIDKKCGIVNLTSTIIEE